ncbi:CAAX prenyl protease [Spiromyces aspiralis]|uniref:CAAX prenyl protease n=1 Tax=Spiromyces aspiralis TaxID=68401 RepID=A0ACC1HL49_9FUNG|nr:CAAX prenyl protease [Spiromyces aspiralis]
MGIVPASFSLTFSPVLFATVLTLLPYLGSLFSDYYLDARTLPQPPPAPWSSKSFYDINLIRNYIVGPIVEELVFRSAIVPLWTRAAFSPSRIIFLSPAIFSLAHAHHLIVNLSQCRSVWAALLILGKLYVRRRLLRPLRVLRVMV